MDGPLAIGTKATPVPLSHTSVNVKQEISTLQAPCSLISVLIFMLHRIKDLPHLRTDTIFIEYHLFQTSINRGRREESKRVKCDVYRNQRESRLQCQTGL